MQKGFEYWFMAQLPDQSHKKFINEPHKIPPNTTPDNILKLQLIEINEFKNSNPKRYREFGSKIINMVPDALVHNEANNTIELKE